MIFLFKKPFMVINGGGNFFQLSMYFVKGSGSIMRRRLRQCSGYILELVPYWKYKLEIMTRKLEDRFHYQIYKYDGSH